MPVLSQINAALGHSACSFWVAVIFDMLGMLILGFGVFSRVYFYDFLIYLGGLTVFISLFWWLFWFVGNIELPPDELHEELEIKLTKKVRIVELFRRISCRFSSVSPSSALKTSKEQAEDHSIHSQMTISWGGTIMENISPVEGSQNNSSEAPSRMSLTLSEYSA